MGQVRSRASRRCDGWPDPALVGVENDGGRGFRGKRVRKEKEKKKKRKMVWVFVTRFYVLSENS